MNAIVLMIALLAWQQPQDVKDVMNEGVAEFKSGRYREAAATFQRAVDLDPGNVNAHLYLATAYMELYVPGVESPENLAWANRAEEQFSGVLERRANDAIALASLTTLDFNMKRFDQASEWNRRLLAAQPNDKEAHYWAGVIVWSKFYPELMLARARENMTREKSGPLRSTAARRELLAQHGEAINEAIAHLRRAIEIDPKYVDAMSHLNLLIRERADLRDTAEQYRHDIDEADQWVLQALRAQGLPDHPVAHTEVGPVRKVDPACPAEVHMRVSGTVKFTVTIGKDGSVAHLQAISGNPLLIPSALDAVKRWEYATMIVDGKPMEYTTPAEVNMNCTQP